MTKQELLEKIQALPDDIVFLVSSDEEGNSFRTANFDDAISKAYNFVEWQVLHPDDVAEYEEDGVELTDVVVFW